MSYCILNLRVYVLEFPEQPLVFPANEFLVPYHLVPRGIELRVLASQRLVLGDVRVDQLAQLRALHLGQFVEINRRWCHGYRSSACKQSMRADRAELLFCEIEFLIFEISYCFFIDLLLFSLLFYFILTRDRKILFLCTSFLYLSDLSNRW